MLIFSIDPGSEKSGFVIFDSSNKKIIESGVLSNELLRQNIACSEEYEIEVLIIEKIQSYGKPVGGEVFDTCIWIGRFIQSWHTPSAVILFPRNKVLTYLRANKDSEVRQAVIDVLKLTEIGKNRYILNSHAWQAAGLALAYCKIGKD